MALDTRENVFHGGGGGDGQRVVLVDIILGGRCRDGWRDNILVHIDVCHRLRWNCAGSIVDDVRHCLINRVFVRVVKCHPVM